MRSPARRPSVSPFTHAKVDRLHLKIADQAIIHVSVHRGKKAAKGLRGIDMRSALLVLSVGLLFAAPGAWAQSVSEGNDNTAAGTGLADQEPAANVRGGAVQARAPGQTVQAALARHRELRDLRLGAQRTHETYLLAPEPSTSGSVSNLLGGSLSNLLGSFLNTGLAGTIGNLAGGGSTGTTGDDLSDLPPEVIQMLTAFGIDPKDLNLSSRDDPDAAQTTAGLTEPKTSSRAQTSTTTQDERKFVARWAESMLSTFFTALTVAFQTPDFIDLLKDLLRPIINPQAASSSTDGGTNGQTSGGNGNGGGSSGI
jgi:hypothetical protein